jgi:hypothetical protein
MFGEWRAAARSGAGESDLDLDRRKIRDRIAELKEQLKDIQRENDQRDARDLNADEHRARHGGLLSMIEEVARITQGVTAMARLQVRYVRADLSIKPGLRHTPPLRVTSENFFLPGTPPLTLSSSFSVNSMSFFLLVLSSASAGFFFDFAVALRMGFLRSHLVRGVFEAVSVGFVTTISLILSFRRPPCSGR